jgi:hypothetical protein
VPRYRVEALEKFVVRTVYFVTARSPKQAEKACRSGRVAYEEQQIEAGDEEWIQTISVAVSISEQRQPVPAGAP